MLDCIQKQTSGTVDSAVIWLHGLGADGHDFESIVDELSLPHTLGIRFLFPNAPVQAVTLNGGMRMRSWYDISSIDLESEPDHAGIKASSAMVEEVLRAQIQKGIPAHRCILAGFSQGGLIVLHLGLRFPQKLAGIMALSTYDPTLAEISVDAPCVNRETPVFVGHGEYDPIVPPMLGLKAVTELRRIGNPVEYHTYSMAHSVCMEEIDHLGPWIRACLEAEP